MNDVRRFKRIYRRATPEQQARDEAVRKAIEADLPQIRKEAFVEVDHYEAKLLRHLRKRGVFDLGETAAALQSAREEQNLTLTDICERTGIDEQTLADLESGEDGDPSLRTLKRYAEAVGRTFELSLGASDDRPTAESQTMAQAAAAGTDS